MIDRATRIRPGHPRFSLRPIVISRRKMPRVVDPTVACRNPELGVLSALAHRTFDVARAALVGIRELTDQQQARLYCDVIMDAVPAAIRRALEANMERYEYKSEFARRYVAQGREEGREEGRGALRRAVIELARAKLGQLSAEDEDAIRALSDDDVLTTLNISLGQARDIAQARAALDHATHRGR
jgi:hypothetical protein